MEYLNVILFGLASIIGLICIYQIATGKEILDTSKSKDRFVVSLCYTSVALYFLKEFVESITKILS